MIPVPESLNKYFKIVDDNTLIYRPSISKILFRFAVTFGLPTISWFIGFDYWIAYGFGKKEFFGLFVCLVITAFGIWHGFFIALPSLRERITFDIKNRIIRDEYGKHYKFKDTYSFDDIYFTYETSDDISISGESYVSQRRIYFIDKKTRKPRCELALNTFCYDYQEMLFFLQELCEPNNTFEVKS